MTADSRPYTAERVRGGVRAFVEGHAIAGLIGVAVALVLVRTMEPEQYAVYATIPALVVFAVEIASFGLPAAVARFVPEARMQLPATTLAQLVWRLLAWRMAIALAVTALLTLATPALARVLNLTHAVDALIAGYAYLLAFIAFSHLQKTLEALLAQQALKRGMLVEWAPKAVILFTWIGVVGSVSAAEAIAVHAATATLGAIVLGLALARLLGSTRSASVAGPARVEVIECARNQWLQTLLTMPSDPVGLRLVAATLLPTTAMAAFGFHHILAGLLSRYLPIQLFVGLIDSLLVARYLDERRFAAVSEAAGALLKLNLFVVLPLATGAWAIGPELTALITGGRYAELAWVLPVLLLGIACESAWLLVRAAANAVSRTALLVRGGLAAFTVLVFAVGLAASGFIAPLAAIAIATIAAPAVRSLHVYSALRREAFTLAVDWGGVGRIALIAIIAVAAARAVAAVVASSEAAVAIATIVAAVPLYLGLAMLWRPFTARERELIGRILGGRRFPW